MAVTEATRTFLVWVHAQGDGATPEALAAQLERVLPGVAGTVVGVGLAQVPDITDLDDIAAMKVMTTALREAATRATEHVDRQTGDEHGR